MPASSLEEPRKQAIWNKRFEVEPYSAANPQIILWRMALPILLLLQFLGRILVMAVESHSTIQSCDVSVPSRWVPFLPRHLKSRPVEFRACRFPCNPVTWSTVMSQCRPVEYRAYGVSSKSSRAIPWWLSPSRLVMWLPCPFQTRPVPTPDGSIPQDRVTTPKKRYRRKPWKLQKKKKRLDYNIVFIPKKTICCFFSGHHPYRSAKGWGRDRVKNRFYGGLSWDLSRNTGTTRRTRRYVVFFSYPQPVCLFRRLWIGGLQVDLFCARRLQK